MTSDKPDVSLVQTILRVTRMKPGTKVRLSGVFLRNTGQMTGGEGLSKWTVVECDCSLCASGRFVAVDEPGGATLSGHRHFAEANLVQVGVPSIRNDP